VLECTLNNEVHQLRGRWYSGNTGQKGVHTAGRDLSPSHTDRDRQTWTVAIAAFSHARALSLASEQVVRRGSCFSSPHSKKWAVRICGNGVEARLLND
jgi:hypothetical protein